MNGSPKTQDTAANIFIAILTVLTAGLIYSAFANPDPEEITYVPTPSAIITPTPTPTPVLTPEITMPPELEFRTICNDGTGSFSVGSGTCSHHSGIDHYTGY